MSGFGTNIEGVVRIVNDNDGHMYVIPASLRKEFMELLGRALISGDHNLFISSFSKYMKNPDDLKLYTDEI